MRKAYVVAVGLAEEPEKFAGDPRYRKATRCMVLANSSLENALKTIPNDTFTNEDLGLVLGSCHGELEVTINFLVTKAATGVARPILFQNSLHNSTTGFLSMAHRISGPMLTVSSLHFTGEDTMDTGLRLIRQDQCRACLVSAVEARVPELVEALSETNLRDAYVGEGAATILLANEEFINEHGLKALCELEAIEFDRSRTQALSPAANAYESDAIERFIHALAEKKSELSLAKVDGTHSKLKWRLLQ